MEAVRDAEGRRPRLPGFLRMNGRGALGRLIPCPRCGRLCGIYGGPVDCAGTGPECARTHSCSAVNWATTV